MSQFHIYRQMRGEELEGLSVEELQQMEKNLEAGLQRVLCTKVGCHPMVFRFQLRMNWQAHYQVFQTTNQYMLMQDQQFMQEISELQQKVNKMIRFH